MNGRFDQQMDALADTGSTAECRTWFDRRVGDVTEEDGSVFIVVDEGEPGGPTE